MVLVRDQERPPHFTEFKRGFGNNGAYAAQERNGLFVSSLAGENDKYLTPHSPSLWARS